MLEYKAPITQLCAQRIAEDRDESRGRPFMVLLAADLHLNQGTCTPTWTSLTDVVISLEPLFWGAGFATEMTFGRMNVESAALHLQRTVTLWAMFPPRFSEVCPHLFFLLFCQTLAPQKPQAYHRTKVHSCCTQCVMKPLRTHINLQCYVPCGKKFTKVYGKLSLAMVSALLGNEQPPHDNGDCMKIVCAGFKRLLVKGQLCLFRLWVVVEKDSFILAFVARCFMVCCDTASGYVVMMYFDVYMLHNFVVECSHPFFA